MAKERPGFKRSEIYVDAPVNIGLLPSFIIYLFVAIKLLSLLPTRTGGEDGMPIFPLIFLMVFFAPALYNRKKSIFEKTREVIKTFTGGGFAGFFQGTGPFSKLLIYDDAIPGFGIIYGNLMIMSNKNKQNVEIFKNGEYQSGSDRAPGKFNRVIVEYDPGGIVEKETVINFLGDTTVIRYKNGKAASGFQDSYSYNFA